MPIQLPLPPRTLPDCFPQPQLGQRRSRPSTRHGGCWHLEQSGSGPFFWRPRSASPRRRSSDWLLSFACRPDLRGLCGPAVSWNQQTATSRRQRPWSGHLLGCTTQAVCTMVGPFVTPCCCPMQKENSQAGLVGRGGDAMGGG